MLLNTGIALALTRPDGDSQDGSGQDAFEAGVRAGMDLAATTIDSGDATALAERWVAATRTLTVPVEAPCRCRCAAPG